MFSFICIQRGKSCVDVSVWNQIQISRFAAAGGAASRPNVRSRNKGFGNGAQARPWMLKWQPAWHGSALGCSNGSQHCMGAPWGAQIFQMVANVTRERAGFWGQRRAGPPLDAGQPAITWECPRLLKWWPTLHWSALGCSQMVASVARDRAGLGGTSRGRQTNPPNSRGKKQK